MPQLQAIVSELSADAQGRDRERRKISFREALAPSFGQPAALRRATNAGKIRAIATIASFGSANFRITNSATKIGRYHINDYKRNDDGKPKGNV
jgi:hypothetical protein